MANLWDNTRWETLFDQAVTLADARRLSDTLSMLKRIRSWQHRQKRYGRENHDWHDAELLWLQGVVLERARQPSKADPVWLRLAQVYQVIARSGESAFLPRCARCAERVLGFAPSWFSVAKQLRDRAGDVPAIATSFRKLALGTDAVNVRSATDTLPRSIVVLKRISDEIVGVGAIKPPRPDYAADKAQQSGHAFDSQMRELGYVAVRTVFRGQGISKEITAALLSSCQGQSLFATTSNEGMMKTLGKAGFVRRGEEWKGNSGGTLQLWIKE